MKTAQSVRVRRSFLLAPAGAVLLSLLGAVPGKAAVFDYSPLLDKVLVSRSGVDLTYRVYDPEKGKYVGESEVADPGSPVASKGGFVCFESNGEVSCRVYDSFKRKWVGTGVDSGTPTGLVGASGIISWVSGRYVHLVVYDCARAKWVAERLLMEEAPTGLMIRDGIVTWQEGATVHYAVYDPESKKWKEGDKFSEGTVRELAIADGVLSWHNGRAVFMRIYDPKLGEWRGQKVTTGEVEQFGSGGGAVAWTSFLKVYSNIYDPARQKWVNDSESTGVVSDLMVSHGTVCWISGVNEDEEGVRGYDPREGRWRSHATPAFPYFTVSPRFGEAPLKVHFIDMSFGATGSGWEFGDGGASFRRSPGHTYYDEGAWIVRQTVTGVGDQADMRTMTVPVGLVEPEVGEVIADFESLEFGPAETMEVVDGVFQATIVGKPGQVVVIESSLDMKEWQPAATIRNRTGSVQFIDGAAEEGGKRYYRVKTLTP